jgi:hypothetical protein
MLLNAPHMRMAPLFHDQGPHSHPQKKRVGIGPVVAEIHPTPQAHHTRCAGLPCVLHPRVYTYLWYVSGFDNAAVDPWL